MMFFYVSAVKTHLITNQQKTAAVPLREFKPVRRAELLATAQLMMSQRYSTFMKVHEITAGADL